MSTRSPRSRSPRRMAGAVVVAALTIVATACSGGDEPSASVQATPCPTSGTAAAAIDALCTSTPPTTGAALASVPTATPAAVPTMVATATMPPAMAATPAATTTAVMASPAASQGATFKVGALTVAEVMARAAPAGERSAAFLTVTNTGTADDALIAAAGDIAESVEVHETVMENGMAKMQPIARIPIPAGGSLTLKSGGYHIMMLQTRRELVPDTTIPLTLTFERAGSVTVQARVATYTAPAGGMGGR